MYMDAVFQAMSKFRFFYANLPVLLAKNPTLKNKYIEVQSQLHTRVGELMLSLRKADIVSFKDEELADIVSILRLINTFWLSFYQTQTSDTNIDHSVFLQGVLKILVILRPYVTESALPEFNEAQAIYQRRFQEAQQVA